MKYILFALISFIAITALVTGVVMITHPEGEVLGLSSSILESTPFHSFLLPGLYLALVVGGSSLIAVVLNLVNHPRAFTWTVVAGVLLTSWMIVQLIFIPYYRWVYVFYLFCGILMILVAYQLMGKAVF